MKHKAFQRIFFGIVLFVFLTPFVVYKELLFPFVTSKAFTLRIVVDLALPLYVFLIVLHKQYRPSLKNPLTVFVLLFWVCNLIASFTGVNVTRSLWGNFERMGGVLYLAHLTLLYFYVLLLGAINARYAKIFLQVLVGVSSLMAFYGVIVRLGGHQFVTDPSLPRVSATFGNPIFFASFLVLPLAVTLYLALEDQARGWKIMYWLLALMQLVAIFLTGTRGAVVGLGLGILFGGLAFLLLARGRKLRLTGLAFVAVLLLTGGVLYAARDSFAPGSMIRRAFSFRDANASARLIQWQTALKGFKDKPLLGVGPENYYVVSNKYFNQEMYKFDRSWFDKPHNYLLEILATSGILGFIAYAGVLIASAWILFRAWREQFFTAGQAAVLFAGALAYQIQNLFVFDTVSASLMFFSFTGFLGYVAHELSLLSKSRVQAGPGVQPAFAYAVLGVASLCGLYVLYTANVQGIAAAKNVNYGYAYMSADAEKSAEFFERARDNVFNFDRAETASKNADFAVTLIQNPSLASSPDFLEEQVAAAMVYGERLAESPGNDPIIFQKLTNLYFMKSVFLAKTAVDPRAEESIVRALELAPGRVELELYLVQIRLSQNRVPEAVEILENIARQVPSHLESKWQLATVYHFTGDDETALPLAEEVIAKDISVAMRQNPAWVVEYYANSGRVGRAIELQQELIKLNQNNITLYVDLARLFVKAGDKEKARQLAEAIMQAEPARKTEMEGFIQSLNE